MRVTRFAAFLTALVLTAMLYAPSAARAQAGEVGAPLETCVRRVTPEADPRGLLLRPAGFDCTTPQRAFGPGSYDVVSGRFPPRFGATWPGKLRIASLWQDRLTLWVLFADGTIAHQSLDSRQLSRRLQLGAIIEHRLPYRHGAVTRALWRVEGATNVRGIVLGARAADPIASAKSNLVMGVIYAGFAGLCIALLVYNLALWTALRHRFQLAYCAMLVALLIYAASSSGALAWLWPSLDNNDRIRVNYVMLAASAAAALAFARSFFEAGVFGGWVGRAATGVTVALIGSGLVFAVATPWHARLLDLVYTASFALLLAIVVPVLFRAWQQRSNYLWLFSLAWGAPIAFAVLRLANGFDLLRWSFWTDNSTVLAMMAEGLLSSLAIAYRIHLLSRDRDEAREQEIAARMLADTDPLTGLLNRRAFLSQAIGRPGEQTLLILDIDHFKRVNETIGHDGGDEVLRVVARALRQSMPPTGLVARLGGEEFACLSDAAAAVPPETVLDRLRAERMPFDVAITSSVGTCTGPLERETDWKALYRRADQALFAAKAAGRDRARDATQLAA